MTLAPVHPLHNRLGLLAAAARHPRLWYDQHLDDDRRCWCDEDGPDQTCDKGEALWRLARAPEREFDIPPGHCRCWQCRSRKGPTT